MKALATVALALALAATASAQSNDATLTQSQGDDGLYHLQATVGYAFPGLPPRTNNSGVGTLRLTLPDANLTIESVDAGYLCTPQGQGVVVCTNEGQPQDGGTAFPNAMGLRLVSPTCVTQAGTAELWAAPNPAGSPDVTLPIQAANCGQDPANQPVVDTKETCKVPNVKNEKLAAAVRELVQAVCKRGKVTYAFSRKVKKGFVISQSARPGKTLPADSKVNLVVSRGKKK